MDNKGFTLIELLAVIVLLAVVMTIGGITVNSYLDSSRKESKKMLIENIKIAAQNYYEECKYAKSKNIECENDTGGNKIVDGAIFPLERLKKYGFLTTQDKDIEEIVAGQVTGIEKYIITDPISKKRIEDCMIKIEYNTGHGKKGYVITPDSSSSYCPQTY